MTFIVRVPDFGEVAEIVDLHVATWRETYTHLLPEGFFDEEHVQRRHQQWRDLLEEPREEWRIRVAEQDGRIIGLATVGPSTAAEGQTSPRDRQLYMLYVLAAEHGRGAGQALLDEVLGDEPAVLWVAKENARAIAFYRRNGFAFDGVEEAYPGTPSLVDARMVR